jgi:hypothetical protein
MRINDPEDIKEILHRSKTIAVVGLSSKPMRPSYGVARYVQSVGYRIIPVNPHESMVLGERAYSSLTEIKEPVDVVDIFRRCDQVGPVVDEAIEMGAWAVWMQEGVYDEEAAHRALAAGLKVVMNKCLLKEHLRYGVVSQRVGVALL